MRQEADRENPARLPLEGLTVGRLATGTASEYAAWLLATRGATVVEAAPAKDPFAVHGAGVAPREKCSAADILLACEGMDLDRPAAVWRPSAGIATGDELVATALLLAGGAAMATAALAARRWGRSVVVPEADVTLQVLLPEVMAACYRSPAWPAPSDPVAAPGGGWLSAELGAIGDAERYALMLSTLRGDVDAAETARAAQEWRLPVCDYRPPVRVPPAPPVLDLGDVTRFRSARLGTVPLAARRPRDPDVLRGARGPLADVSVCDLTAMWAGPLATWLLGRLGASVHKIEPAARLDGTRALDGRGVYPDGVQVQPGEDSALFWALNRGKSRLALDLRQARDRDSFFTLAASCDLIVDSFSPRVMPNLGVDFESMESSGRVPTSVSLPAFPPGPMRDWVAYGTGVHAVSGLGQTADGSYFAPAVAYPDPVAGFTAAFAAVAAIVGLDRGDPPSRVEVPLLSAVQPMLALAGERMRAGAGGGANPARSAMAEATLVPFEVAGRRLPHPYGPFLLA